MLMNTPPAMTDDELVASIAMLTGRARDATSALVAHLVELERRGLLHALGFRTLYGYCRTILHLSEHESYNRMEAAGVARRFPVVLPMLAEGLLHLTAVSLLGPHLEDENHLALLGGSIHKSKREVEALLARWFPKAETAASIRKLPASHSVVVANTNDAEAGSDDRVMFGGESTGGLNGGRDGGNGGGNGLVLATPASAPSRGAFVTPPRRAELTPVAAERYQVKFTASEAMINRLREAQELLSHSVPSGDLAEIFDQALIALLEKAARRKYAATSNPRTGRATAPSSRNVPAAVERQVWTRDGGRCAFVASGGRRCEERRFIEFHHLKPWAAGGPATAENIALRCRAHNAYEAEVYFGPIRAAREEVAAT
jgi:hypothetical protein